jgi:transcriptional regulator GlxA family with amidase domain
VRTRLDAVNDWATVAQSARYRCENIAATCLVSDRHLERYFLKRFGVSPKQWVQSLRMELANSLLRRGYTTKAAAEELCYEGASQFAVSSNGISVDRRRTWDRPWQVGFGQGCRVLQIKWN